MNFYSKYIARDVIIMYIYRPIISREFLINGWKKIVFRNISSLCL
jgi:hypothetical protein